MAALEAGEELAQGSQGVVAGALGGQPRGHALQRRPDIDHLDDLGLRLAHHEDAAPRHAAHEALLLEQRDGLADRRAAYAEILRELALVQPNLDLVAVGVPLRDCPLSPNTRKARV